MTTDEIKGRVEVLAAPLLVAAGVELVELKVTAHGGDVGIAFFADLPTGGITIDVCERLNKGIAEELDKDGFLGGRYTLEFSSPGLDRPLKTNKDFLRNLNQEVRFILNAAIEGKSEWTGIVMGVKEGEVTAVTKHKQIVLPIDQIIKAVLVI